MYADPSHIRAKRVNLSLTPAELRVAQAVSELNNKQLSAFLRELIMESLNSHLHGSNSDAGATEMRATR